jgi:hypothetical protein
LKKKGGRPSHFDARSFERYVGAIGNISYGRAEQVDAPPSDEFFALVKMHQFVNHEGGRERTSFHVEFFVRFDLHPEHSHDRRYHTADVMYITNSSESPQDDWIP